MSIDTRSPLKTNAAYAAKETYRTSVAYDHAKDVQDVLHELTLCVPNGANSDIKCGICTGCTFRTSMHEDPRGARLVARHIEGCLSGREYDPTKMYLLFKTDLSGLGVHYADMVFCSVLDLRNEELEEMIAKAPKTNDSDKEIKLVNSVVWDIWFELCEPR